MNIQKLGALGFAIAIALAGCSSNAQQSEPAAQTEVRSRAVTDLSDISATNFTAGKSIVPVNPASSANASGGQSANSPRMSLESPKLTIHAGSEQMPGTETLLNDKAAQFPSFSRALLDHVFTATQDLERGEVMSRLKLPDKMQPVILTGVMDKDGQLQELIIQQHSGEAYVDKLLIKACKKGLWAHNPPPEALSAGGVYRVKIEGSLENYTSDNGIYTFTTKLGLSLL